MTLSKETLTPWAASGTKERPQERQDRPCIQKGEGGRCPRVPLQSSVPSTRPPEAPSCALAGVHLGFWIPGNRLCRERSSRSPRLSPTSHHRGGYSAARTVADRRVHLQNPLGHKRLQTFPCEESQGRIGEGAGRAQVGTLPGCSRNPARPDPYQHVCEHPPPPNFRSRLSCPPRPRGRRGDLQSPETQDREGVLPRRRAASSPPPAPLLPRSTLPKPVRGTLEQGGGRSTLGAGERGGQDLGIRLIPQREEGGHRGA